MQAKKGMRLGDDGTMDTVVVCADCGEELRYNFDGHEEGCDGDKGGGCEEYGQGCYSRFCDWALKDAAEEHECEEVAS